MRPPPKKAARETYALNLYLAREHRGGVSAPDLAAISGVDEDRINKIQSSPGKQGAPRGTEMEQLAAALMVPLAWLAAADAGAARQCAPGWLAVAAGPLSEGDVPIHVQHPQATQNQSGQEHALGWVERVKEAWLGYLRLGKDARRDPRMAKLSRQMEDANIRFYRDDMQHYQIDELITPMWLHTLAQTLGVEDLPEFASLAKLPKAVGKPPRVKADVVAMAEEFSQEMKTKHGVEIMDKRAMADIFHNNLYGRDALSSFEDPISPLFYVALLYGPSFADTLRAKLTVLQSQRLEAGGDWEVINHQIHLLRTLRLPTDAPLSLFEAIQSYRRFRGSVTPDPQLLARWQARQGVQEPTALTTARGQIVAVERLEGHCKQNGADPRTVRVEIERLVAKGLACWKGPSRQYALIYDDHDLASLGTKAP